MDCDENWSHPTTTFYQIFFWKKSLSSFWSGGGGGGGARCTGQTVTVIGKLWPGTITPLIRHYHAPSQTITDHQQPSQTIPDHQRWWWELLGGKNNVGLTTTRGVWCGIELDGGERERGGAVEAHLVRKIVRTGKMWSLCCCWSFICLTVSHDAG